MIKDNRPFANENGWVDDKLITDIDEKEQKIVFKWIDENIMPRQIELTSKTSYGIKHILEKDTGIYLTNNQFKDAMMYFGYQRGEARVVMNKAIRVCMECIGIG